VETRLKICQARKFWRLSGRCVRCVQESVCSRGGCFFPAFCLRKQNIFTGIETKQCIRLHWIKQRRANRQARSSAHGRHERLPPSGKQCMRLHRIKPRRVNRKARRSARSSESVDTSARLPVAVRRSSRTCTKGASQKERDKCCRFRNVTLSKGR